MLLALGVRLHGINQSLVTFHPTRHYRSAVIARACYYDATPSIAAWARRLAGAARSMQPAGEPPFMEWIACESYRAIGHEDIRVPRIVVMICWILGAIPLHALARRASSGVCAIVAAALYLFMPYAIVATRSFQPDAPMTLVYSDRRARRRQVLRVASDVTVRHRGAPRWIGHGGQADERVPDAAGVDRTGLGAPAVAGARRQSSIRAARAARVPARDAVLRVQRGLRHACPRPDAHALRAGAPHLELLLARLADADPARVRAAALRAVGPRPHSSRRARAPAR